MVKHAASAWAALRASATAAVVLLMSSARALAQDAAEDRSQSFQAVKGAVQEDVPGGPLLLGAYGVIWVIVLLFVVRVVRQQRQSERDLARLQSVLQSLPSQPSESHPQDSRAGAPR